jgi:hypothetical protein
VKCITHSLVIFTAFFAAASLLYAQLREPPVSSTQPPNLLLLVRREFYPGKNSARQKLETAISRACEHLNIPNAWIDLEALTGRPEALSFDPFDSFDDIDRAGAEWPQIFARNAELGRLQGELEPTVSSQKTLIAVRRDDVGYRPNSIDLSKARVMRILEVHLFPGHDRDFLEALQLLAAAYERINSDTPWVVYQVNVGDSLPSFLVIVPMAALRQNDDLLSRRLDLMRFEGEENAERLQQIAREAFASTESNLYTVSPEMSHVFKEFADNDPDFWRRKSAAEQKPTPAKPPAKPSSKGANSEPQ